MSLDAVMKSTMPDPARRMAGFAVRSWTDGKVQIIASGGDGTLFTLNPVGEMEEGLAV